MYNSSDRLCTFIVPYLPFSTSHIISSSAGLPMEEQLRRLQEERTCKVCMDKEVSIVFIPCGHLVVCKECAPSLRKCPICRGTIKGTVRTFLSWGPKKRQPCWLQYRVQEVLKGSRIPVCCCKKSQSRPLWIKCFFLSLPGYGLNFLSRWAKPVATRPNTVSDSIYDGNAPPSLFYLVADPPVCALVQNDLHKDVLMVIQA